MNNCQLLNEINVLVFTTVNVKVVALWNVIPCSLVEMNTNVWERHVSVFCFEVSWRYLPAFRWKCCLHLQNGSVFEMATNILSPFLCPKYLEGASQLYGVTWVYFCLQIRSFLEVDTNVSEKHSASIIRIEVSLKWDKC
jgi:hypothetical protein